jgi:hypothetical protein
VHHQVALQLSVIVLLSSSLGNSSSVQTFPSSCSSRHDEYLQVGWPKGVLSVFGSQPCPDSTESLPYLSLPAG